MQARGIRRRGGLGLLSLSLAVVGSTATWASGAAVGDETRAGQLRSDIQPRDVERPDRGASADPGPYRVVQPDGTRITLVGWGDAQTHGYATPGGHAVVKDASGVWRYALGVDAAGGPVASRLEVGKAAAPAAARSVQRQITARAQANRTHAPGLPGTGQGKQPALVVLVSFTNQDPVGSTESTWAEQFFGPSNSVAAYYRQNSFNAFRLAPATETSGTKGNGVVGWLELPYAHPDFGSNFGNQENKLGADALKAADRFVDYESFDKDHDGVLSPFELRISIIVAGYETSYGGEDNVCGPSVWAHQGGLYGAAPKLDGTIVNYDGGSMLGEWLCRPTDTPGHLLTLGGMVMMMGFDTGMPTLWDTDFSSAGLGDWSLMSGGNWNSVGTGVSGSTPAGLDAFSKSYQGWITPTPVLGPLAGAALPASATSPTAYRLLDNPGGVDWMYQTHAGEGEYFLVENRQLIGFDAGLPACGVIVYHVDEGVSADNDANARDGHRFVDVVEANGAKPLDDYQYRGSAADVFPGSSGHVDFTDQTSPPAKLYSGKPSGIAMHVNGGCAPTVTANFYSPIPNDAWRSAAPLEGTLGSVTGGNTTATKEAGEPAVAGDPGGASIWYRFKPPAAGTLALSTKGSTFDTLLGVYRGASVSTLKRVATNDDVNNSRSWSAVTAEVERGKTYYVAIDGRRIDGVADQGTAELGYQFRPANDDFRHATVLGAQGKLISSNEGAGLEDKEPRKIADQKAGQSIWYTFKPIRSGVLLLDLSGSGFDTLLSVSIGTKVSKLRRVADDDNHGNGSSSRLSLRVAKGTTYRIAVAGVEDATGKVVLRWHL